MRRGVCILSLVLAACLAAVGQEGENFVVERTFTSAGEYSDVVTYYDGVGRLAAVETNGGSYRTDYGYNVWGWLTEISSPLMEQTLNYTEHSLRKNPYMNGNINSITTKNNLLSPATGEVMGSGKATVTYMYDKLNRLESSTYEPEGRPSNPGAYNTAYTYDLNGNITMLSRQGINERLTDDGEVVYAGYGYDLNSNMVSLVRKGQRDRLGDGDEVLFNGYGTIDSLAVALDGNRLLKVTDNMEEVVYGDAFDFRDGADEDAEYEYDANGNMTVDLNRGIKEIEYDLNNRPVSVTFSTRPAEQRTKYLYDASGRKLRTTYQTSRFASLGYDDWGRVDTLELNPGIWDHIGGLRPLSSPGFGDAVGSWNGDKVQPAENLLWSTNFIRDYCGDIIYKDGEIERILTDNGYAVPDSAGGYDYYYYVKDWQGNVRAVIDEANRRMELNNYYPYGMPMSSTASVQPYKYGGKELDRANGLDMYDFEARHYDPVVPHFITMDELCEKYPSISPYAYCAGNPIRYIDPTGRKIISHEDNSIGFNMKYGVARKYIMDNGMGDHLKKIADDENIILYIKDNSNGKGGSYFDADNNTLYLDLNNAAVFENGKSVSPAVIVVHELDHIQRYYYDNKGYLQDVNTNDGQYKNKEEKRVIEGSEQDAARKFGEIEENETTRTNHNVKEFKPVDEPYKKWNDERNF